MRTKPDEHHLLFHPHSDHQSMSEGNLLHALPDRPPPILHPEYHPHLVQTESVSPAITRDVRTSFVIILLHPIQHTHLHLLHIFLLTIQIIPRPPLPIILPYLTRMILSRSGWTPSLLPTCHSPSLLPPDQSAPTTVRLVVLESKVMRTQKHFVKKVTEEDHTMSMSVIVVATTKKKSQKKLPEEVRARIG